MLAGELAQVGRHIRGSLTSSGGGLRRWSSCTRPYTVDEVKIDGAWCRQSLSTSTPWALFSTSISFEHDIGAARAGRPDEDARRRWHHSHCRLMEARQVDLAAWVGAKLMPHAMQALEPRIRQYFDMQNAGLDKMDTATAGA